MGEPPLKKDIFFLSSMPRAGNTLLASLINQTQNVKVTANSVIPEILWQLHSIKNHSLFQNFPDHNSLNNVIDNVFDNYYKDWDCKAVIDRSCWGLGYNYEYIKHKYSKPKFIILYRPVLECLASFIKLTNAKNPERYCQRLMSIEGPVGRGFFSIKNIIDRKEDYFLINYKELATNTKQVIEKLSNYINQPLNSIEFTNLKQLSINNVSYNDTDIKDLHAIRTSKIEYLSHDIEKYLPMSVIDQYGHLNIQ